MHHRRRGPRRRKRERLRLRLAHEPREHAARGGRHLAHDRRFPRGGGGETRPTRLDLRLEFRPKFRQSKRLRLLRLPRRRLGGEFGEGRFRRRVAIRQRGERNVVVRLPIRLGILRRGFVVLRDVSVGVGGDRVCLLRLRGVGEERLVHDGERRFDGNLHRRLLFTAALGRGGVETRAAATTTSRGGDSLRALGAFALLPTHPLVPEHKLIFADVGVVSFVVLREISRAAAELRASANLRRRRSFEPRQERDAAVPLAQRAVISKHQLGVFGGGHVSSRARAASGVLVLLVMSFFLHSDVLPVGPPVDDVVLELTRPLDHLKRARVGAADLLPRARHARVLDRPHPRGEITALPVSRLGTPRRLLRVRLILLGIRRVGRHRTRRPRADGPVLGSLGRQRRHEGWLDGPVRGERRGVGPVRTLGERLRSFPLARLQLHGVPRGGALVHGERGGEQIAPVRPAQVASEAERAGAGVGRLHRRLRLGDGRGVPENIVRVSRRPGRLPGVPARLLEHVEEVLQLTDQQVLGLRARRIHALQPLLIRLRGVVQRRGPAGREPTGDALGPRRDVSRRRDEPDGRVIRLHLARAGGEDGTVRAHVARTRGGGGGVGNFQTLTRARGGGFFVGVSLGLFGEETRVPPRGSAPAKGVHAGRVQTTRAETRGARLRTGRGALARGFAGTGARRGVAGLGVAAVVAHAARVAQRLGTVGAVAPQRRGLRVAVRAALAGDAGQEPGSLGHRARVGNLSKDGREGEEAVRRRGAGKNRVERVGDSARRGGARGARAPRGEGEWVSSRRVAWKRARGWETHRRHAARGARRRHSTPVESDCRAGSAARGGPETDEWLRY